MTGTMASRVVWAGGSRARSRCGLRGFWWVRGLGWLRGDRGAASLWVLAAGCVLVAAGLAGAAVGAARVARHQAWAAADLAALAGAVRTIEGPTGACPRAATFAAANGARLVYCAVDGLELVVTVRVDVVPLPGLTRSARASARAGPVSG